MMPTGTRARGSSRSATRAFGWPSTGAGAGYQSGMGRPSFVEGLPTLKYGKRTCPPTARAESSHA